RPAVVDLGSGTGLSSLIWADRAASVIGVEPSRDMRIQAGARAEKAHAERVSFVEGLSVATGLSDGCADIVTCSQSLHWMEPEGTFAEVARILRDGGIFAAYDCDWPPTLNVDAERAYEECRAKAGRIEAERGISPHVHQWRKSEHLDRISASGRFRYAREVLVHHVESGGAERLVGLMLSQGEIAALLKHGLTEDEIGITDLRQAARRALGDSIVPWYWSYRIRMAVK
ncbi:MAG TPA: class I SAM-dependent methyltransferase, partial [Candidatus Binataceae bacterium]|nr:class I SAM-dependent methyltransferase [Candidatus Binataceae bacterium]